MIKIWTQIISNPGETTSSIPLNKMEYYYWQVTPKDLTEEIEVIPEISLDGIDWAPTTCDRMPQEIKSGTSMFEWRGYTNFVRFKWVSGNATHLKVVTGATRVNDED